MRNLIFFLRRDIGLAWYSLVYSWQFPYDNNCGFMVMASFGGLHFMFRLQNNLLFDCNF